jgi:energy-coupling factor transporter ATP-binding protein EcfA2
MDYPHDRLIEVAIGDKSKRGFVIPANELGDLVKKHPGEEVYRSFYMFDQERLSHAAKKGAVKDFLGDMYVEDLHFDFDGEGARSAALNLVVKLTGLGVNKDWIRVWFSGNKGYHVWIPDVFGFRPGRFVWQDVKATMSLIAPGADRMPASKNGLIRAPWSLNAKTGLYKVPIAIEELTGDTEGQIRALAASPSTAAFLAPHLPISSEEIVFSLSNELVTVKDKEIESKGVIKGRTSSYFGCMNRLWERGPIEGRRHQELLRMITAWKHQGLGSDQCITLGRKWIEGTSNVDPYKVTEMVTWAFETGANHYSCSTDKVMLDNCVGAGCPLYKYRDIAVAATSMGEAANDYKNAILNPVRGGFNLSDIYEGVRYSIQPGEIVLLLADTKIGKSSLFLNWACSLSHLKTLFITPEMNMPEMFQRTLQIKHGLMVDDKYDINEVRREAMNGHFDEMVESVSNIRFITSPPYLEDMGRIIATETPDIVVIDPLEMIHVKAGNGDKNDQILADGLRQLANAHKIPLLVIHHINKDGQKEGGATKIEAWMAKGMKRIAEQVDHLFMFEGSPDQPFRRLRRDRGRRPQMLDIRLVGNPKTFQFALDK